MRRCTSCHDPTGWRGAAGAVPVAQAIMDLRLRQRGVDRLEPTGVETFPMSAGAIAGG